MGNSDNMDYLVCAYCLTYNHAPYINDTMNGFCIQQTNFPYVCVIIDDASTDGEQKVIENYLDIHFDLEDNSNSWKEENNDYRFVFARHKTNKNCFFATYLLKYNHYKKKPKRMYYEKWMNKAKYVAVCEGDDYWCLVNKLQIQADFLEQHADYGLVYGKSEIIDKNNNKTGRFFGGPNETFDELFNRSTISSLTVLYRKSLQDVYFKEIRPIEKGWLMGDYPKWLFFAHESKVKFVPDVMGRYRILDESASHSKSFEKSDKYIHSLFDMKAFYCSYYDLDYPLHDFKYKSLALNAFKHTNQVKTIEYLENINNRNGLANFLLFVSNFKPIFLVSSYFYKRKKISD